MRRVQAARASGLQSSPRGTGSLHRCTRRRPDSVKSTASPLGVSWTPFAKRRSLQAMNGRRIASQGGFLREEHIAGSLTATCAALARVASKQRCGRRGGFHAQRDCSAGAVAPFTSVWTALVVALYRNSLSAERNKVHPLLADALGDCARCIRSMSPQRSRFDSRTDSPRADLRPCRPMTLDADEPTKGTAAPRL